MNEKITYFGKTFVKRKFDFNLVEDQYCMPSDAVSLMYFAELVLFDYEKYPKKFLLDYFSQLLNYYNNCNTLTGRQRKIKQNVEDKIKIIENFEEDRHIEILCRIYKLKRNDKEKICSLENKYTNMAGNYNLGKSIEGKFYSEKWCKIQEDEVKENFELNMKYFSLLDKNEFDSEVINFLKDNEEFIEIYDLSNVMFKSGYYIMVLDNYKQVYIGTSLDIGGRILKHWQSRKQFDRLIFPWHSVTKSKLSIDSFRILDTTRIFVYITDEIFSNEEDYIQNFSPKFVLNRVTGGNLVVLPRKQIDLKENK